MNRELRALCQAYANGRISRQLYLKMRRDLIDEIIRAEKTQPPRTGFFGQ